MKEIIPILSLITAILAVFVGPLISWRITKRQIASSLKAANKQIVASMGKVERGRSCRACAGPADWDQVPYVLQEMFHGDKNLK